jgi:hypothetical protein
MELLKVTIVGREDGDVSANFAAGELPLHPDELATVVSVLRAAVDAFVEHVATSRGIPLDKLNEMIDSQQSDCELIGVREVPK